MSAAWLQRRVAKTDFRGEPTSGSGNDESKNYLSHYFFIRKSLLTGLY